MARAVQTAIDSLNFFVESRNAGNILNITTTGTGSNNSGDLTNTDQRGAMLLLTVASLSVSAATLNLSILIKDVSTSTYFPYLSHAYSLTTGASTQYVWALYVGAVSTADVNANVTLTPMPIPNVFQVAATVSITGGVTATNSQNFSYRIDYSKVM